MSWHYNPSKANLVAYALSRLSMDSVAFVTEERQELEKDVHKLARLGVHLMSIRDRGLTIYNVWQSLFVAMVKKKREDIHHILLQLKGAVHQQRVEFFSQG